MKIKPGLICILIMIISAISAAQSPGLDDYKRAVAYQWGNLLNKKVFNVHVQPIWFSDSTGVAYVINGKKGKIFLIRIDCVKRTVINCILNSIALRSSFAMY